MRTLDAFRQRHTIPEDLPPLTSDEELVAWGQQLIGKPDEPRPRREPLRATRTRARSAETMTLDELFDDIAARAARAHNPARLRRVS